jgi:hypothetical protein
MADGRLAIFSSIHLVDTCFHALVCAKCVSFLASREKISMARKVGTPDTASVDSLKQDRIPVVVKELFLSFRKRTNVQNFVRSYSHSLQRRHMSYRRYDQSSRVFKADEATVK